MKGIKELLADPKWTQSRSEEIANSVSHGVGLAAALIAAPFLIDAASAHENRAFLVGTEIFVATMLLLYLGSTLYHAWPRTALKCVLRVIDHSAIFLLIAGTYSPFMLGPMRGVWGWTILGVIWLLAIVGVLTKLIVGVQRPKVAMPLYLGMGWLILVAIRPLSEAVPFASVAWLLAGGIAYTTGLIFFAKEHVRYNHFVWHLFVLAGTLCHFCAIFSYAA